MRSEIKAIDPVGLSSGPAPRVAFLLPALASGGMERVTLTLAAALSKRGSTVDLVLERRQGGYLDRVPTDVSLVELSRAQKWKTCARLIRARPLEGLSQLVRMAVPGSRYLPLGRLASLVEYLRQERPDVMIAAHGRMPLLAIWARELANAPTRIIIVEHSTLSRWLTVFHDEPEKNRRWHYRREMAQRLYPRADGIVAVSNGVANDLASTINLDRDRVTTIYNPVVSDRLRSQSIQRPPHRWFDDDQPPVVLGVGRLVREKNFAALIESFAILRAERTQPVRLMIIGEGEQRSALQALIVSLGLESHVCLPGWIDNPYSYMHYSAVFALSSLFEGLGIVLIEAMACGCPVVAVDCPSGPREILDGGRYGRLVPMQDPAALARAMAETLLAPPDPALLRTRAEMFSVDNAVEAYTALMMRVMDANSVTRRVPRVVR